MSVSRIEDMMDDQDLDTPGLFGPEDEPVSDPLQARKSAGAYRTISEVADELTIPQHVRRFWETKFAQLKPLKRGGGRRYYRPEDVSLVHQIHELLYAQGYTIKGAQKVLKEGPAKAEAEAAPAIGESTATKGDVHQLLRELLEEMKQLRALV